jgi:putative selenium metabolism protein SsnA
MRTEVLYGGTVVTSLSPPQVIKADVAVAGGRILDVSPAARKGDQAVDCSRCLILPGLVCAHHHLYSSLARGMPFELEPPTNFVEILRRVWWRLDRALDLGSIYASAAVGGAVALLSGTTTIVDHHASPNAVDLALTEVGVALGHLGARGVLCYEVSDRDGPQAAAEGLKESRRFEQEERASLSPGGELLRTMVGAHASFTLSEDTLRECVQTARDLDTGIHIHVAEDLADQRDAQARFGVRVVRRLADLGVLDDRAVLAHCIHVDDEEMELIRASGATAVHNPRSNMNNGVGHAPVGKLNPLALGTDGIGGDMFAEGRAAYWRAREEDLSLSPRWVLDLHATSARVAGRVFDEPLLGTIQRGAPADLAVLEYDPPTPLDTDNLAGHWVFGLTSRHVRDVMVGGEWSVRNRRLARVDSVELTARCVEAAQRLWARMEDMPEHPFTPAGGN